MFYKYLIQPFTWLLVALGLATTVSCQEPRPAADMAAVPLIPIPASLTATGSSFLLTEKTGIYTAGNTEEMGRIAGYLADKLKPATGFTLAIEATESAPKPGNIYLKLDPSATVLGDEGYTLVVTEALVTISAAKPAGIFYGVQTLRQLLPATIEAKSTQAGPWIVPTGTIEDQPRFGFRSSMLDVSRHFFGMDDVKRYMDLMAGYKMNTMHLHLSDDQGWRIEIKSWPNLTAIGGKTEIGGGEGGFFTQEQYKELVQYAADRYILVIPEIDMPGHTNAALASYPELNCDGKATKIYTGREVGFSTLCTSKEVIYAFVDSVVRELAAITPGPYIHVGGDESHATKKEDYIPFVNRVHTIVTSHGKQMIGWDETAQTDLDATSTVQLWASPEFGRQAVAKGAKMIMSPATKAYLDMQYDKKSRIGLHWAAYIEVDSAYIWDPVALIPGIGAENIIGIEAALWTETVEETKDIDYLVYPRLIGYAEIGWSPQASRDWETYKFRLAAQAPRLKAWGVDYYPSAKVPWKQE